MNKQCISCKYSKVKPNRYCACNDKIKQASDAVQMKYNGANLPFCDGFKQLRVSYEPTHKKA